MNNIMLAFFISFIASFSTLLGILPIFISQKFQDKVIAFSLSFSAGVMIIISIFSLIPEAFQYLTYEVSFPIIILFLIFFLLGVILSFYIDYSISIKLKNSNLYRLGLISIFVLMLHNIPEGIMSFFASSSNLQLGIILSIGIALHNIPEGIAIAVPIYYSTFSKRKAFALTFIAGFSELLGAILAYLFFIKYLSSFFMAVVLAITAGIMMHISICELLPNSLKYNNDEMSILGFIIGCSLMLITVFIL